MAEVVEVVVTRNILKQQFVLTHSTPTRNRHYLIKYNFENKN